MERVKSRFLRFMREIKRKIKKIKKKITKKPEEAVFVLLVALALVFAGICFGTVKRGMQNETPLAVKVETPSRLEKKVKTMVSDFPMKKMAPYIAKQNEKVAAYLVAIAKKESDFGKYSPKKRGKNCYNYWGFKGTYNRNAAGYSCFDSPAQAVNVVGKRINNLIAQKVDTPREMVVWKCGSACTAASDAGAAKWVSDVDFYYRKMYN